MRLYAVLSRVRFLSYRSKILIVSFIGVHVPMIAAVTFVLLADSRPFSEEVTILGVMLLATLVGTAATVLTISALLAPIRTATDAIRCYLRERRTPMLPTTYTDEAGILLSSIQEGITRLDAAIEEATVRHDRLRETYGRKFEDLAGMSHHFRTPLNHIIGLSSLLSSAALGPVGSEAYRQSASVISDAGASLLDTLQTVLELSEAEARDALEAHETDLVDIVAPFREAVALEHLHAERSGVRVVAEEEGLSGRREVIADPRALKQLLGLLLQLAIDDTGAGGTIRFVLATAASGTRLRITDGSARLSAEDVPSELREGLPWLTSMSGDGKALLLSGLSTSPTAVRLSLISTLARMMGATLRLLAVPEGPKTIEVILPSPAPEEARLAA